MVNTLQQQQQQQQGQFAENTRSARTPQNM
jgi:hypothetical protein